MKKLIFILLTIFGLISCAGYQIKQDVQHNTSVPLHALLTQVAANSVYQVHTVMTFKSNDGSEGRQKERTGLSFAINKRQLLTAEHLVSIDDYIIRTPYGVMTIFIPQEDKAKEETWIFQDNGSRILVKVVYKNKELDFAVLEVEDDMVLPIYSIGNSDDFHIFDRVFTFSNIGWGTGIKSGHIMQLGLIKYVELQPDEWDSGRFGLCMPIMAGDSGSPILLDRNGGLEVGGVVIEFIQSSPGVGYGIKINAIMDSFKDWQNEREW